MMETVELDLGDNAYSIYIGVGILDNGDFLSEKVSGSNVFIVTNESIAPLYLESVEQAFRRCRVDTYVLPDGESYKNLASCEAIFGELLSKRHNRSTTLVALGGGVVGDVTGFVAATYQRGVDFLQIPTTLLAQVDSSVGGKTAVNHPLGKNMIGAFHQPKSVYIDINTLKSLPARELSAGFAEVIKHGALADSDYFSWIEKHMAELLEIDVGVITEAVRRSCQIKASIVAQDEKEAGLRALLNLGHTFGHAIEHSMGYGSWLHGEAVGTGLVMAADLSARLDRISPRSAARVKRVVSAAGLPTKPPPELTADEFLRSMLVDKKATDSGLRFILLNEIGTAELVEGVDESVLRETLEAGEKLAELG